MVFKFPFLSSLIFISLKKCLLICWSIYHSPGIRKRIGIIFGIDVSEKRLQMIHGLIILRNLKSHIKEYITTSKLRAKPRAILLINNFYTHKISNNVLTVNLASMRDLIELEIFLME